jgi:hypothetical protein
MKVKPYLLRVVIVEDIGRKINLFYI